MKRCRNSEFLKTNPKKKKKKPFQCCFTSLISTYPHAPQQWLVCFHYYGLPWVSMDDRFIGVGGAYQFSKLQDLVICGGQGKQVKVLISSTADYC